MRLYGSILPGDQHALTSGEDIYPRILATGSGAGLPNQSLRLVYFTAAKSEAVSQIRMATSTTGAAGATPTLIRFGLYSVDVSSGDLTLVASTPNDTALLAANGTSYTKSFSVAYAKVAGARYAVGGLCVTGATAPSLIGVGFNSASELGVAPRMSGLVGSQSDLPASVAAGSISGSGSYFYAALLP